MTRNVSKGHWCPQFHVKSLNCKMNSDLHDSQTYSIYIWSVVFNVCKNWLGWNKNHEALHNTLRTWVSNDPISTLDQPSVTCPNMFDCETWFSIFHDKVKIITPGADLKNWRQMCDWRLKTRKVMKITLATIPIQKVTLI